MKVYIIVREDEVQLGQGHLGVQLVVPKLGADYDGDGGTPHPGFTSAAAAEAYLEASGMVYSTVLEIDVRD